MTFDWNGFVAMWVRSVERGVARIAKQLRDQHVYAIVFHQGYAETNGKIDGYSVALNTTEALAEYDDDEDDDGDLDEIHTLTWSPADWAFEELDGDNVANARFYRALTKLACSSTREHWYTVYNRHERAMSDAARELARRAKKKHGVFAKLTLARDFVVFVHDTSREGPPKARASIPAATYARLFPNMLANAKEAARFAKLPPKKRAAYYISRLGTYDPPVSSEDAERGLVALGAHAVGPLARALDSARGTTAAQVLVEIGAPAAAGAAKALLAHARKDTLTGVWCARALGSLRRLDLLEPLARTKRTRRNGIAGVVAARPASYPLLEQLLAEKVATKDINERIAPGRVRYRVTPDDYPALARAAISKYAAIRMDVACTLGDEALGKHRALAVSTLITMLGDRSAQVQRLAALALGRMGQDARPALVALQMLAKSDAPNTTREAATHSLKKLATSSVK